MVYLPGVSRVQQSPIMSYRLRNIIEVLVYLDWTLLCQVNEVTFKGVEMNGKR